MCLAIFKPKGVEIKKKYLRNGWDNNEDGAGFALARGNAVEIHKGFFTFKEFYTAFKEFNNPREVALIHFRWGTHGPNNAANCHPFSVCGDKYAMIHNGIIDIKRENFALSDTAHFCELVLQPILEKGVEFDSGALRYLVEGSIGDLNKIVLLRGDGAHVIFHEKKGEWKNGSWYSNNGYQYASTFSRAWAYEGKGSCGAYAGFGAGYGSGSQWKRREQTREDEMLDAAYWQGECESVSAAGYGSEWEYQYNKETNKWSRVGLNKRIAEMTEEEWRKECEEELEIANRDAIQTQAEIDKEENEKYSG